MIEPYAPPKAPLRDPTTPSPSRRKRMLFGFLGIMTTTLPLKAINIAQGIVMENWSGVHPINRIFNIPLLVAVSAFLAFCIYLFFVIFRIRPVTTTWGAFRVGLVLGCIGIGGVLHPWLYRLGPIDEAVIVIVGIAGLVTSMSVARTDAADC